MTSYTSQPYTTIDTIQTVLAPGAVMGQSASDTILFYNGPVQQATDMVVGQYYTIVAPAGLTWSSYGTLQAAPLGTGVANGVGAVYLCTSAPTSGSGTVTPLAIPLTNAALTNSAFAPMTGVYSGLTSTTPFGFDSLAHAQALVNQVAAIDGALKALGLIRSA